MDLRKLVRRTIGALAVTVALSASGPLAIAADRMMILGVDAGDLSSLDPAFTATGADEFIARQLFNTLVAPPDGTLDVGLDQIVGELAESWTVSDDSKVWTFKLRPGVKWHKGYGEVSAEDVKFSFERQLDPESGALFANNFSNIDEIVVVDPLTVEFRLKQPSAFFHLTALMPRFGGYIVPKAAVEELGDQFGVNPVGSGPFQFVSYTSQQGVVSERNPDYFDGPAAISGIEFRYVPDGNARTIGLVGGELDLIEGVREPGWVEKLQAQYSDAKLDLLFPGSTQTVFLNLTKPPLDDLKVRQAIVHALDPAVWAQAFGVIHQPMYGIAPEQFYGGLDAESVPEELRYAYDPELSKRLLAEAGYADGVTIQAIASERADYKTNTLLLQDQLRKVGINLDVRFVDHATYHEDSYNDLNTFVIISTTQAPNALTVLRTFFDSEAIVTRPASGRNYSHYGDVVGSIDDALETAELAADPEEQLALIRDIQLQILRDLPAFPLQGLGVVWVRQPWVTLPFEPTAGLGHYSLADVELTQ